MLDEFNAHIRPHLAQSQNVVLRAEVGTQGRLYLWVEGDPVTLPRVATENLGEALLAALKVIRRTSVPFFIYGLHQKVNPAKPSGIEYKLDVSYLVQPHNYLLPFRTLYEAAKANYTSTDTDLDLLSTQSLGLVMRILQTLQKHGRVVDTLAMKNKLATYFIDMLEFSSFDVVKRKMCQVAFYKRNVLDLRSWYVVEQAFFADCMAAVWPHRVIIGIAGGEDGLMWRHIYGQTNDYSVDWGRLMKYLRLFTEQRERVCDDFSTFTTLIADFEDENSALVDVDFEWYTNRPSYDTTTIIVTTKSNAKPWENTQDSLRMLQDLINSGNKTEILRRCPHDKFDGLRMLLVLMRILQLATPGATLKVLEFVARKKRSSFAPLARLLTHYCNNDWVGKPVQDVKLEMAFVFMGKANFHQVFGDAGLASIRQGVHARLESDYATAGIPERIPLDVYDIPEPYTWMLQKTSLEFALTPALRRQKLRALYLPGPDVYRQETLHVHPHYITLCEYRPSAMHFLRRRLRENNVGLQTIATQPGSPGSLDLTGDKTFTPGVQASVVDVPGHLFSVAFFPQTCTLEVYHHFKPEYAQVGLSLINMFKSAVSCEVNVRRPAPNLPSMLAPPDKATAFYVPEIGMTVKFLRCDVQEGELIGYCQSWALYFLYLRFMTYEINSIDDISTLLCSLSSQARIDAVTTFWKWLKAESQHEKKFREPSSTEVRDPFQEPSTVRVGSSKYYPSFTSYSFMPEQLLTILMREKGIWPPPPKRRKETPPEEEQEAPDRKRPRR